MVNCLILKFQGAIVDKHALFEIDSTYPRLLLGDILICEFQEICPTTNFWVEEKDYHIKTVCKTNKCFSCIQHIDFVNQKLQKGSEEWKRIVKYYEERRKKYPPHGVKGQCKWICPECGDRCGGVEGHSGPHQCPKHYKPKEKI